MLCQPPSTFRRCTSTQWPPYVRSDVTFATYIRPLTPKPTRGATLTVTGLLFVVRQCARYDVWIVGDTLNVKAPFACVVAVARDWVPLPYGCAVSVTGSLTSWFDTAPERLVLLPYVIVCAAADSVTVAAGALTVTEPLFVVARASW